MKRVRWFLVLMLGLFIGCAQETDPAEQFALDVLDDNFTTTDYSALVEITGFTVEADHEDLPEDLDVIRYSARVLESYVGEEQSTIEFLRYIEAGDEPQGEQSVAQVVSLCRDENGELYIPDLGYELPAVKPILEKAREIQNNNLEESGNKRVSEACQ